MKKIEKEYEICSEFKPSDANNAKTILEKNGKYVDNWYLYTTPDVYNKLFNKKIQGKEKLPWKRKVVKIYSKKTKCSVYRIWRGTFRTVLAKDILYVDRDAKYILTDTEAKTDIILYPSNKILYYWNHFAPEIRAPFKLGFISLFIGLVSLFLGIISLLPINEKIPKYANDIETQDMSRLACPIDGSQKEQEGIDTNKINSIYPENSDNSNNNVISKEINEFNDQSIDYERIENPIEIINFQSIYELFSVDDDEVLAGRTLVSYSYGNVKEREVYSWVEMFTDVIKQIYDEDSSQIRILAADKNYENIIISSTEKQGDWFKIDTDIYLYTHNSTNAKMRILNKVFDAYGKDKNELVFNLKPEK